MESSTKPRINLGGMLLYQFLDAKIKYNKETVSLKKYFTYEKHVNKPTKDEMYVIYFAGPSKGI